MKGGPRDCCLYRERAALRRCPPSPVLHSRHLAKRVQVGSPSCCVITKMPILREEGE